MAAEHGQGMDRRTIVPLRNAVETLTHGVDKLTRHFPSHMASLGSMLRDNAVALSKTVAAASLTTDALKNAYDLAHASAPLSNHDAEYLLFFLLFARYVSRPDVPGLFEQIYDVKRLIIEGM
jgi:hypothetical protein